MKFLKNILCFTDHKKVQYVIDCPNISSYRRSELERLRDMLSTLIQAQFDDVIVAGIEEGCVIVTFMIRKCLIQNLRSFYSDKTSTKYMAYRWMMKLPLRYKVVKVIIEEEIVYTGEVLCLFLFENIYFPSIILCDEFYKVSFPFT